MKYFTIAFALACAVFANHAKSMDLAASSQIIAADCDGKEISIMILVTTPGIVHLGFPTDICKTLQEYRKEEQQKFDERHVPPGLPADDEQDGRNKV